MNNNVPNFKGFPTDNSSTTNLKYDIIANKFMNGIENHKRYNRPVFSFDSSLGLVGAVLQLVIALFVILGFGISWILKKL